MEVQQVPSAGSLLDVLTDEAGPDIQEKISNGMGDATGSQNENDSDSSFKRSISKLKPTNPGGSSLPHSTQTPSAFLFKDTTWLGGSHDGQALMTFHQYSKSLHACDRTNPMAYAAQFQCLFTFGLLEAVMENKVLESDLLRQTEDGRIMMTARCLPGLLRDWRTRVRALDDSSQAKQEWAARSATTLQQANGLLQLHLLHPHMSDLIRRSGVPAAQLATVYSAIACIAQALTSSRAVFNVVRPLGVQWSFAKDVIGSQQAAMVSAGWCPFIVRGLESACVLQYASTMPPPRGQVQYTHDRCTNAECVVNSIDTSNYTARHVREDCRCPFIGPSADEVIKLLGKDDIPVLQISHVGDGEPTLTVASGSDAPYVAISHVWSDGLGSTTEQGLPCCQVNHLASLVAAALPGAHLWMDSLCVPAQKESRKRAIGLMAKTYQRASVVLVRDSGIRTCSAGAPMEEKLLRVIGSGWMQRLWTLQEAMLAQKLVFELSDTMVDVADIIPSGEGFFDPLLMDLASEVFRLRHYQSRTQPYANFNVSHVAHALRWRSTSKAADETLAVAGLLGIDAMVLVQLLPGQRMRSFLLQIGKLPRDIVFVIAPRLDLPYFQWAPTTLMTKTAPALSLVPDECTALCTSEGLIAEFWAIFFDVTTLKTDIPGCCVAQDKHDIALKLSYSPLVLDAVGRPPSIQCNSLLFLKLPKAAELTACIAASIKPATENTFNAVDIEEERFHCYYVMRLIATRIDVMELRQVKGPTVTARGSGRIRVRML
ncbi:hypothetical protein C8Q76DRAFT_389436 [Earliella scabrosa]|nr:hypothetical protein C8Q76DRAFT_389436 [Earliella scabrosa]